MYRGVMENRRRGIETEGGLRPYSVRKEVLVYSPLNFNEDSLQLPSLALLCPLNSIDSSSFI